MRALSWFLAADDAPGAAPEPGRFAPPRPPAPAPHVVVLGREADAEVVAAALTAGARGLTVIAAARRDDEVDALMTTAQRVVLVTGDDTPPALRDPVLAELRALNPRVTEMSAPADPLSRALWRRGWRRVRLTADPADAPAACSAAPVPAAGRADGQAAILIVAGLCSALVAALVVGAVARGVGVRDEAQRAADVAALAGARALLDAQAQLFSPNGGSKAAYLAAGRTAADRSARANGAQAVAVAFPDEGSSAPVRVRVTVRRRVIVERGDARAGATVTAVAEAEVAPQAGEAWVASGGYSGPLAVRQGKPMRPDVARAFDRLAVAARADGVHLIISSAFRSDTEQAVLWARNPDPRWVAPPGKSLHRYATELDLGPTAAYPWLARNAPRFHFVQRYAWEPWHWGFTLNPRSAPRAPAGGTGARPAGAAEPANRPRGTSDGRGAVPDFVPRRFASHISRAAQRWNVSATLLSAQLYAESGFNPYAVSPAGARGIAQFMPATASAYGLRDPHDARSAIDAQARMMRDLLRRFASVPLALAAYNAGPARVAACGCVPPFPETRGYVARILALMSGAGEAPADGVLAVRLVR